MNTDPHGPNFDADNIDHLGLTAGAGSLDLSVPLHIAPGVTLTPALAVNDKAAIADEDPDALKLTAATVQVGIAF